MIRWHVGVSALALLVITAFTACANTVSGTATWPGAKLEKVLLTAADFPSSVPFDRIIETPGQPDGAGAPPAMLSMPEGCSDGLTRVIAASAERGAGSAAKYSVAECAQEFSLGGLRKLRSPRGSSTEAVWGRTAPLVAAAGLAVLENNNTPNSRCQKRNPRGSTLRGPNCPSR